MPAFISSRGPAGLRRGTDDPCFEGWGASNYPTASIYKALSKTETPFEFLPRETVCRALLARGFQGFPKGASLFQQAKLVGTLSLSIPQALAVGRDLGADGVMLVGIGNLATGGLGWVEHLGARILDV